MKYRSSFFVLLLSALHCFSLWAQVTPLPQAHAHNDYEHERPLLDALDQGFTSVEVDVHLVEGVLRVAHDPPDDPGSVPTLEEAYLRPLAERIKSQGGTVYSGYTGPFFLMIDIKTAADPTYRAIHEALQPFRDILSVAENGVYRHGAATVFLSGDRPVEQVLADPVKLAFLDGRPEDLRQDYPAEVMPVISDHYRRHLSWTGEGTVPEADKAALRKLVKRVHGQGKKLRLWASPENESVWTFLLDNGADFINTDELAHLRRFLLDRSSAGKKP